MAPRLILVVVALSLAAATLPPLESAAFAAGLDAKGRAVAKEASGLYRQGRYEDAAKLFAELIVDHPDMPIFERSLGACFYYLRKPEPALSNLRNYLLHRDDVPADDKAIVDRWIDEMEKLRAQNAAAAAAAAVPTPAVSAEAPLPMPAAPAAGEAAPAPSPVAAPAVPAAEPVAMPPAPAAAPATDLPPSRAAQDLSGPPAAGNSPAEARPFYKRWWFWGTVGAVVAAGAVTAVVLSTGKGGSNVPPTPLGNQEGI
jgi:hypothetical protein